MRIIWTDCPSADIGACAPATVVAATSATIELIARIGNLLNLGDPSIASLGDNVKGAWRVPTCRIDLPNPTCRNDRLTKVQVRKMFVNAFACFARQRTAMLLPRGQGPHHRLRIAAARGHHQKPLA